METLKYKMAGGFTSFQIESEGREGSLYVRPHACHELSKADVAEIQKREPKAARGMYPFPAHPKKKSPKKKAPKPEATQAPEKPEEAKGSEAKEEKPAEPEKAPETSEDEPKTEGRKKKRNRG